MLNLIVGIIIISIIAYIIFVRRTKKLYNSIDILLSKKSDSITIKQSLDKIRTTVQAQFNNVIFTDKTILFEYNFNSFIVVAINNKEVLIRLAPAEDEIESFEKLENEVTNTDKVTGVERMKALAGDMIEDIISTSNHTRIHENYDDFIQVFKEFPSFKEYEEASTVVISRDKSNYKIIIMREDNSFSAYWEPASFKDLIPAKNEVNELTIENKLKEFSSTLPIHINQRIKLNQVFGNEENVWLIFQVPERGTPEEDTKAINYLINTMKENSFVQDLNKMGTEISIQIIANNQQNVATSSINFNDDLEDLQPIINRLNIAELDYLDIESVFPSPLMGDTVITIKMNNEENFSLVFDSIEDMQVALELINYKINVIPTNEREEYFDEMGLDKLLIDFVKISFEDFINQYELDSEHIDSIYKWKEKNDEKDREEKIVDFNNYSLRFMDVTGNLSAMLIHQSEEKIAEEERKEWKKGSELNF